MCHSCGKVGETFDSFPLQAVGGCWVGQTGRSSEPSTSLGQMWNGNWQALAMIVINHKDYSHAMLLIETGTAIGLNFLSPWKCWTRCWVFRGRLPFQMTRMISKNGNWKRKAYWTLRSILRSPGADQPAFLPNQPTVHCMIYNVYCISTLYTIFCDVCIFWRFFTRNLLLSKSTWSALFKLHLSHLRECV